MNCGPAPFDLSDSIVATMTLATAQVNLDSALVALHTLNIGAALATISVSQGDGSRTVSYQVSDPGKLTAWIRLLQAKLGINTQGRRPMRFNFT